MIALNGSFIDAISNIGQSLKHLNLNNCFSINNNGLCRIADCCPNIKSINFNCCNLQDDSGLIYLISKLNSSLTSISLRQNVNISDNILNGILKYCGQSLIELDISGCILISEKCVTNFIVQMCKKNYLQKMIKLYIACGVGKGKLWIWTMNDKILNCIINQWIQLNIKHPKNNQVQRQLSFVVDAIECKHNMKSRLLFKKLLKMNNLTVYRLISKMQPLVESDSDIVHDKKNKQAIKQETLATDSISHQCSSRFGNRRFNDAQRDQIPLSPICQETWINGRKCQTLKL